MLATVVMATIAGASARDCYTQHMNTPVSRAKGAGRSHLPNRATRSPIRHGACGVASTPVCVAYRQD
jgi:hypothetical protein